MFVVGRMTYLMLNRTVLERNKDHSRHVDEVWLLWQAVFEVRSVAGRFRNGTRWMVIY